MPASNRSPETATCHECKAIKKIREVHSYEWKAVCITAGCTFGRFTGLSRSLAVFLRDQHAHKNPAHMAAIGYEPNPHSEKARERLIGMGIIKVLWYSHGRAARASKRDTKTYALLHVHNGRC